MKLPLKIPFIPQDIQCSNDPVIKQNVSLKPKNNLFNVNAYKMTSLRFTLYHLKCFKIIKLNFIAKLFRSEGDGDG